MKRMYFFCLALLSCTIAHAQITHVPGPSGSGSFGARIVVLTNGNYVVTDPYWSNGGVFQAGAVYLYNGATHALISTLTGSNTNDRVGSLIYILSNGNYVVNSPEWDNASASNAGAVTWVNGNTGVNGVVSPFNSLVGSKAGDQVGSGGVYAVGNSNYVVRSPDWDDASVSNVGAVTWANGTIGISGVVSSSNSLVGSKAFEHVGSGGVTALSNGNYVVRSPNWDNASIGDAGAVTWASGVTGLTGVVSTANSVVGSTANDQIGSYDVIALSNGNYVVISPNWDNALVNNVGAVTWGNGVTGVTGAVSISNSLVGSTVNDQVGSSGVLALNNGNYVVKSRFWHNASANEAGAVTWGSGTAGVSGAVSSSNSLVGSNAYEGVGSGGVTALSNGNYVVVTPNWSNDLITGAGAVTWGSGITGVTGMVSASNSLVGSTAGSFVGSGGVTVLNNGNYVISSPNWNNDLTALAGAVTWGNGATGVNGVVSASNSLVGSAFGNAVGSGGITALSNGNYVVISPYWDNASVSEAGAVTWGNGATGVTGIVSISNSLVGSTANDQVGSSGIVALNNGNYVIQSPFWDNGSINDAGAATWGSGIAGINGMVSVANSLVGSTENDLVGSDGIAALSNGNYVVISPNWDNASVNDVGAATWGNGNTGVSGVVNASNSLVGSTTIDRVAGRGVTALGNGNYVVISPFWDNAPVSDAGAVTWGNGTTGVSGTVSTSNSLVGSTANDLVGSYGVTGFSDGNYVVESPDFDNGLITNAGASTYGSGKVGLSGVVNSCNSVLGTEASEGAVPFFVLNTSYDYLLLGYGSENFYVIHSGSELADDNTTVTETIDGEPVTFLSDCSPIGMITPAVDATDVSGPVAMKVHVVATAPVASQPYVRRYYDISPEFNVNTATGRITLFYAQADFDDFNENRGSAPALPGSPTDVNGIENFRITQNHGTSATGTPGSYTGWTGTGPAVVLINPEDEDILWNSVEKRWEVSFDVTGFSGFFAHSNVNGAPLPVLLVSFTAHKVEDGALVQWSTSSEVNASHFEIERSVDGQKYNLIGTVQATGNGVDELSYSFIDIEFSSLDKVAYYRLRLVDIDGSYAFSRVERVQPVRNLAPEYLYPNPARTGTPVTIKSVNEINRVQVLDLNGRKVNVRTTQRFGSGVVLDQLTQGTYLIRFNTQSGYETRRLVVE